MLKNEFNECNKINSQEFLFRKAFGSDTMGKEMGRLLRETVDQYLKYCNLHYSFKGFTSQFSVNDDKYQEFWDKCYRYNKDTQYLYDSDLIYSFCVYSVLGAKTEFLSFNGLEDASVEKNTYNYELAVLIGRIMICYYHSFSCVFLKFIDCNLHYLTQELYKLREKDEQSIINEFYSICSPLFAQHVEKAKVKQLLGV